MSETKLTPQLRQRALAALETIGRPLPATATDDEIIALSQEVADAITPAVERMAVAIVAAVQPMMAALTAWYEQHRVEIDAALLANEARQRDTAES